MAKKCIVCDAEAEFQIKGTNDSYCKECADENFSDLSYLQKVEEEAVRLKQLVEENMQDKPESK